MFKSLFTLALLAIASGHELDRAAGTWDLLKVFSTSATPNAAGDNEIHNSPHLKLTFAPVDESLVCERDGEEITFPAVHLVLTKQKAGESSPTLDYISNVPMKIVQIGDETKDLTKPSYTCLNLEGTFRTPVYVLRFINDDYVVMYYPHDYVFLMTKLKPNEDTVKLIIESDPVLKTAREVQSYMPIRS